jgi:hypothetical protein
MNNSNTTAAIGKVISLMTYSEYLEKKTSRCNKNQHDRVEGTETLEDTKSYYLTVLSITRKIPPLSPLRPPDPISCSNLV